MDKLSTTQHHIAILPAQGLGDGLIQMTLAYHLARAGKQVTFYHRFLTQMDKWFPLVTVKPNQYTTGELAQYDAVIVLDYQKAADMHSTLENVIISPKKAINKKISMLENIVNLAHTLLNDTGITKENGITPPSNIIRKKEKNRIILHPESSDPSKNWSAKKFIILAGKLKASGWHPVFILSPDEQKKWRPLLQDKFETPYFETIDQLATFVAESAFMIGNDSGIGHLASNLSLPTISIFSSKKRAVLWRPDFYQNRIVTPTYPLPKPLKNRWGALVSVRKILRMMARQKNQAAG